MTPRDVQHLTACFVSLVSVMLSSSLQAGDPIPDFPGAKSEWHRFVRSDFELNGRPVVVVAPGTPAPGRPWVWHGEFFGHKPEPDIALLSRGFHIVYTQISDQFGSPTAISHWDHVYQELTGRYRLAHHPALVGLSRGGLYCYNWAAENPDKVACIYADAPVCDVRSWPMGKLRPGSGNPAEVGKLLQAYSAANEAELLAKVLNPVDRLEPLAKTGIPLLHVYGDADVPVPWEDNTGVVAERYRALGGRITLIPKPGVGHVHGLEDPTPIVDFIAASCLQAADAEARRNAVPVPLGSRRELFVDYSLIDSMDQLQLHLHEPRDEGPVFHFDQPWEGPHAGYVTMIRDAERILMYFRGISELTRDGSEFERTCLAESKDGIVWTRPSLGLFEFNGSSQNNIVLDHAAPVTHNFCPLLDTRPGVPADERFKAVGGTGHSLFAWSSPDGIHWEKLQDAPILDSSSIPIPHVHLFDSQNLAFWSESEQQYVCYFRVWDGLRRIARSTSADFRTWSPPTLMLELHDHPDGRLEPAPHEHLYTNQTSPYFRAPHIYIATAARFFEGRQVLTDEQANAIHVNPKYFKDTSDSVFLSSRGGNIYRRTFLEGHLKPGIGPGNWVSRTNYPALNLIQTGPAEMSLFVNQDYAQPTAHVRRYSLRLDGFSSVRADAGGGEFVTRPIVFSGSRLVVNFATSAAGSLQFELQSADGTPIPGLTLSDCQETIGNEIERAVVWRGNASLATLAGTPVRLRCRARDADLYAIQFRD